MSLAVSAAAREWLPAVRERALDAAYQGLLEKELVREQGRRVLGTFGSVKYPVTGRSDSWRCADDWQRSWRGARTLMSVRRH
ncbi:hypothetical protein ACFWN1_05630 [Streptomyces sp. NPDC058459]|uniref:hypothetical protein n=1 Tax=Streptomyces sp. NPDC058459 TaxID=3346508 RepID=UPI0036551B88